MNKEKQEKIDRLKGRLMGKEVLKSTHHSLWDLISIEVSKFWKELRRMEVKKAYIYSALDKHKLATKQLAHLHKTPTERDLLSIKFLKYSFDEALHVFKINDKNQIIMVLQRVIEKEGANTKSS